jgi:uridine kinase
MNKITIKDLELKTAFKAYEGGIKDLSGIKVLADFNNEELASFRKYVEFIIFPTNTTVIFEKEKGDEMFFLIDGKCRIKRAELEIGTISAGNHFGELGLIGNYPRAATVSAITDIKVARLSSEKYEVLISEAPALGVKIMKTLIGALGKQLTEMTDNVGLLLQQRSLPRKINVEVTLNNVKMPVRTGTILKELLPALINGEKVVAALLNNKAVSLNSSVTSDAVVEPLMVANWEGERIYRRSATLLLLEAIKLAAPELVFKLGTSVGCAQWLEIGSGEPIAKNGLAEQLTGKMQELINMNLPFKEEWWTVEEALSYFSELGDFNLVNLLQTWNEPTVKLVTCGSIYSLSIGPLVPATGLLEDFELKTINGALVLLAGGKLKADIINPYAKLIHKQDLWLNSLGVAGVGNLNKACINGEVSQIIMVSESYHEKNISQIADRIAAQGDKIKIICIAGPSSSGKTTFIKRLTIHLQVNGITPYNISLDDYYVDREKTVKDESGDYNFEAIEALDLQLLGNQLSRVLNGEKVKLARYDFASGKSIADGGREICLKKENLLIIEGIHGLNPDLLGKFINPANIFKIFIQPMASLPFDNLSKVNPSDLRLIRRIVRDRHQRGYSAADNIMRWKSVRKGEQDNIFPYISLADAIFDTSLIYELSVLKVYCERYLLEVPPGHPAFTTAYRLRQLISMFVTIYPDHVPPTSILREFIGDSGFEY